MLVDESKNSHFYVNRIPSLRSQRLSDRVTIQITSSVQCINLADNVIGLKGREHYYSQRFYAGLKNTQNDRNEFFPFSSHQFLDIYKLLRLGESR